MEGHILVLRARRVSRTVDRLVDMGKPVVAWPCGLSHSPVSFGELYHIDPQVISPQSDLGIAHSRPPMTDTPAASMTAPLVQVAEGQPQGQQKKGQSH